MSRKSSGISRFTSTRRDALSSLRGCYLCVSSPGRLDSRIATIVRSRQRVSAPTLSASNLLSVWCWNSPPLRHEPTSGTYALMKMSRWIVQAAVLLALPVGASLAGQGITTTAINARVTDANGMPRSDARVVAVHQPSGTSYEGRTRSDGRTTISGMRVGGPYRVTATALGSEPAVRDSVYLALGVAADLPFQLRSAAVRLSGVTVTAEGETVFSSE